MTRALKDYEAQALLVAGSIGRLGCVSGGEAYVVPINYVFDEGFVLSHSLPGKKVDALRTHPRACLQVDAIESDTEWRSVIAYGMYEELHSPTERAAILNKLLSRFPRLTPVEAVAVHDAAAPETVVFRLRVDDITGVAED